ncbi:hypothetical protein TRSC58_02342 [Trypanosoma rangeli SC58]|uniref:Uncharacterized protein n=1 Tax=Trypanosoma rangeli SC58 TaxID=429131 RepID=A0A061J713_TRYRA|nr:hypothetical protein TRSC58_02342 [Trypanosoma rangeli SC58]
MTRTAADAHTTPTAPAACCVDSAVRPISEASVENDPVEALRRRLVARSAAIPLVGRMTHVDTLTPPIRAAAASAGSDPAACVKAHMTSPPIASGTLAEDASPSPHPADRTPTVSLNTSVTTVRVAAPISVAEGKNLLLAYRAMLASASAEREEASILREKLRLYSAQRQSRAGSATRIQQAEAQLHQRLLVLRQRDLDRQATRAQVLQMAKQLEVVLQPSGPFTGLAVEGGK